MSVAAQKRKKILIAVVSGSIAAGAFGFVLYSSQANATSAVAAPVATTPVVVASRDLKRASDKLTLDNVAVEQMPADQVPAKHFSDPKEVVGKYLLVDESPHSVITASVLVDDPFAAAAPAQQLIISNPTKNVDISIPFDEAKGIGGFVQVGDHIDLLVDLGGGNIAYGIQDMPVVKVGGASQAGAAAGGANLLIVELPREKAGVLYYLIHKTGSSPSIVGFALRSPKSFGKVYNTTPVGDGNWMTFLDVK